MGRHSLRPDIRGALLALLGVLVIGGATVLDAQGRGFGGRRRAPTFKPSEAARQTGFMFCRLRYTSVRREWLGHGWDTDYPDSDHNFMLRLSQLTRTGITETTSGDPFYAVVDITDPELLDCPFVFMSDVGTLRFEDHEVDPLREYLLKGGFLWVDDFWGDAAWEQWSRQIARVLPPETYPIRDVPRDHLMRQTLYRIEDLPQIPSIQFWRRSGRTQTSERGPESEVPHLRAIFGPDDRAMVVMTHNTDIADGWEREGEDDEFFFHFSPEAYALGINIVVYALTY